MTLPPELLVQLASLEEGQAAVRQLAQALAGSILPPACLLQMRQSIEDYQSQGGCVLSALSARSAHVCAPSAAGYILCTHLAPQTDGMCSYAAEGLLQEQLDTMRIHADQLSPAASTALRDLASAASELQLSRPTDMSIASAWAALVCDDLAAQRMQVSEE